MKRFLSVLLASMMILGCMAVTVSADVTLALETGDTLTALATDPTVDAGRKVMVNKIEGATYYRNGVALAAADVVDGPKAGTVALPVIEGGNVFQAVVGSEVSSNYVYVKGTNQAIDEDGTTEYSTTAVDYYKGEPVTTEAILTEINPDNSRTDIAFNYYGYRGTDRNETDNWEKQFTSADAAVLSNDCYIKDFSGSSSTVLGYGAFPLQIGAKSGSKTYGVAGISVETDGSLYVSHTIDGGSYCRARSKGTQIATGVSTTFNAWHNYAAVVYKNTMAVDYYVDDVLIAKTMPINNNFTSMIGATISGGGLALKSTDVAACFYFDNIIGNTAATTAEVSATPDQPFDIVPEGGDDSEEPVATTPTLSLSVVDADGDAVETLENGQSAYLRVSASGLETFFSMDANISATGVQFGEAADIIDRFADTEALSGGIYDIDKTYGVMAGDTTMYFPVTQTGTGTYPVTVSEFDAADIPFTVTAAEGETVSFEFSSANTFIKVGSSDRTDKWTMTSSTKVLTTNNYSTTVGAGEEPIEPVEAIAGSIAEGITITRSALADPSKVIAVVAVDANGNVLSIQLMEVATASNTFTVTGAANAFVWEWDTLKPLCAPIQ